ncbi:predicted protein [Arabidopsis lyrata subsp. lyrata]|uniref:Predicted protein n=1 Tax=Arabidopsis lyrata subsp. lyrata TaxID=81972 RepID=D7L5C4_ARALL|nr:predicted protein [Arabidopsis lyrata subsp. lyrata]
MDWVLYVPLEQRDRQVDRKNLLDIRTFKVDESKQSTVVQIRFPFEPPDFLLYHNRDYSSEVLSIVFQLIDIWINILLIGSLVWSE